MAETYLASKWQLNKIDEHIQNGNFSEAKKIMHTIQNPAKKEKISAVYIDKLSEAINFRDQGAAEKCLTAINVESSNKEVRQSLHKWIDNATDNEMKNLYKEHYKSLKAFDSEFEENIQNLQIPHKSIER